MTMAIGVVMTEHIVAGRLEDHKPVGTPVRFPNDPEEVDALSSLPGSEIVEILAKQIGDLAAQGEARIEAIGVAVPGVVRHGVVEDSPNLTQLKGMHLGQELAQGLTD